VEEQEERSKSIPASGAAEEEAMSPGAMRVMGSIWIVAAAVLIWIGFVLDQSSVSSMSGFERILFTVVSVRWFSWIAALAFIYLGVQTFRGARS